MSLLGGPWSPPGVPRGGVSNGNNRKNDNPLLVVPSVNVPYGAAAQIPPKINDTATDTDNDTATGTHYSRNPAVELARILCDQSLMWILLGVATFEFCYRS